MYPLERSPLARALRGERSMVDDMELRVCERRVPLAIWGTPMRDAAGVVRYAIVAFQDISAKRAAEAEHARLTGQLRRAERLEAIGRLAGGVAHDFNNLLTPILAYAELSAHELPADAPVAGMIDQIREAAEQAAELTRQLLAFSRRHVLDARVLDLNQELTRFEGMMRRLIRENIALELRLEPALGRVRADPSQLRRVVMNLALNAADAMPQGGQLLIETANHLGPLQPSGAGGQALGACSVLRVIDTGHGMDADTLTKIFDPFFTTKRPGEGTGLGLPTVYGLVKQHGGQICVRSTPGSGTTFEAFFCRSSGPNSCAASSRTSPRAA